MQDAISELERRLAGCLAGDRQTLSRRLRGLRRALRGGSLTATALEAVARDIARSETRRAHRLALVPELRFETPLPVAEHRDEIARAIQANPVVVVAGDTGSGKTTLLPKIALAAGRGVDGSIALTQPRRIAARSVAQWIARDLGTQLGQTVGFKIRFDDRTSRDTLVRVMTDGVLLAELESDPLLARYDTIIVDEAHERSLNIDFLLGYLKRLLPRRPDLRVVVASATIDTERFAAHFGQAPVVQVGGRMHPIEVRYRPPPEGEEDQPVVDRVLAAVEECVAEHEGDALVFLGGERDIADCADALKRSPALQGVEVLPLFARMPSAEQDRIFSPGPAQRVVLATNIAETSVTVPRIRFVVDSGVARIARWSGRNRVLRLPVEPVSRASADQRKGRCGRVGPGVCVRLYSEESYLAREPFTAPELLRTNLAAVILQMKSLGLGEVADFPFLDAPSPRLVAEGMDTLVELGALDRKHDLTPLGRAMSRLPLDPRLARIVLAARHFGCLADAIVVAAALSAQDPRERPAEAQGLADLAHAAFRHPDSDFASCMALWRAWRAKSAELGSSALRRWSKSSYLSHVRLREWTDLVEQIRRMVEERLGVQVPPLADETNLPSLHRAVLAGFPSQIAQRTEEGEYLLPGGGKFRIFPGSVLARRTPSWVVAAEVVETGRRWGRMLARVQGDWIETVAPHLVQRTRSEPHWVAATGQVAAWERLSYGCLTLVPRRRVPYGPIAPQEARTIFIQHALVEGECSVTAPFVQHNLEVLRAAEREQAKRREPTLDSSSELRFAFFDARVPAEVHSVPAFERWRKGAEARDPRVLFMSAADVARTPLDPDLAARFPDSLDLSPDASAGPPAPLRYEHAPGTERDGVTLQVPLHALHAIDPDRTEWLVPGLLADKVEGLLRTLPKRLRLRFFPLREYAQGAVETLPFGQGSLVARLAEHLTRLTGVPVAVADFAPHELPPHLRMHVEVVDAAGTVLARGRDLAALRRQLAALAAAHAQADLRRAFGEEWQRTGLTAFDLPELPARLSGQVDGRSVTAHPALVDEGRSVRVALCRSAGEAERLTQQGVRRLAVLALREALEHHLDYLPEMDALTRLFTTATGGSEHELRDELALATAGEAMQRAGGLPRTPAEFEARLDDASRGLWDALHTVVTRARALLEPAAEVATALRAVPASWSESASEVRAQLSLLVPRHILTQGEPTEGHDRPRYVRGLSARLRKLAGGGLARDRELQAQVARWERELATARAQAAEAGADPQWIAPFERLLEEFRLSLFAPEIRTAVPVSAQRFERAWREQSGKFRPFAG